LLVVEGGFLWNRPGSVSLEEGGLVGRCAGKTICAWGTKNTLEEPNIPAQTPYLAIPLDAPVGISTGRPRSLAEIEAVLATQRAQHQDRLQAWGELAEVYNAIQTCLAWDTIYEPERQRVISPVSRLWNVSWGGFVLFDWDTYFAAYMIALENKDLAYANAVEITREKTERGFVPNFGTVRSVKSRDRSQPPVGSLVFRELYRRYGDRWLLEEVFDDLLEWNRWWVDHRSLGGLLAWGSDPYELVAGSGLELSGVGERLGAALESGLDNSPMYDDVPFDEHTHLMQLADVGLNGLYILDCEALADIARALGKGAAAQELGERAQAFRQALQGLWDEDAGLFLNRRWDTGRPDHRLSPTNFYPLLGDAATPAQAERMVREHFYNPDEFWGEWILPSIARSDPAFPDQDYWRGRIWAPMNFLVYLGLRRYDLPQARRDLAERSKALLLKTWLENGWVCENYCPNTGRGGDQPNSDRFYHWGGLLGLISLIEAGYVVGPENLLFL
jgi:neutral trehalase